MSYMHGQERILVTLAVAFPKAKAAIVALPRLQNAYVFFKARLYFVGSRHIFSLECSKYVSQSRNRDHPRRYLFGAVIWVAIERDERVGQLLQLSRARGDLQSAELRKNITRSLNGLNDRPVLVGRSVGRKCLGRRRCPDRQ